MDDQARGGPRPGGDDEPAGLSPVRAFLLLGAVLAAIFAGFLATREATPATETVAPARSPDYSLTDAEAIAEFERLNAQLMQAYDERNIALAEDVFTSDSPMLPRVRKEIDALITASVVSKTQFREPRTSILSTMASEVTLERIENVFARFVTETGKPAGRQRAFRETTKWTLRQELGRWLLHDAIVTDRQLLGRGNRDE